MVTLFQLPQVVTKRKKRLGQGWASGAGKTSGRGTKGQHSREKVKPLFEGGQLIISKHLPMLRGKFKNDPVTPYLLPFNLGKLETCSFFKDGSVVDKGALIKSGLLNKTRAMRHDVVILGGGQITKKLIVKVKASASAVEKINKSGGEYKY